MRIRILFFFFIWIQILLLIKVMRICDHRSRHPQLLHFECTRLHCKRPRHSTAQFERPQLGKCWPWDPDPAFNFDLNRARIRNTADLYGTGTRYGTWMKLELNSASFFDQKLQFTDVQTTEEAFSPQRRISSTSKNKIYQFFSMFVGHFFPPGSWSGLRIRIRIQRSHWIRI